MALRERLAQTLNGIVSDSSGSQVNDRGDRHLMDGGARYWLAIIEGRNVVRSPVPGFQVGWIGKG